PLVTGVQTCALPICPVGDAGFQNLGEGLHAKFGLRPVRLSAQGATDTESNLTYDTLSYGVTHDNFDTPEDEGGIPLLTLGEAEATVRRVFFSVSQRDADGDSFENSLDPCPLHADTVWAPRIPRGR